MWVGGEGSVARVCWCVCGACVRGKRGKERASVCVRRGGVCAYVGVCVYEGRQVVCTSKASASPTLTSLDPLLFISECHSTSRPSSALAPPLTHTYAPHTSCTASLAPPGTSDPLDTNARSAYASTSGSPPFPPPPVSPPPAGRSRT